MYGLVIFLFILKFVLILILIYLFALNININININITINLNIDGATVHCMWCCGPDTNMSAVAHRTPGLDHLPRFNIV